jgi:hypothetical protein
MASASSRETSTSVASDVPPCVVPVRLRVNGNDQAVDPQATARQLVDPFQRKPADVDQMGRLLDLELHQVEQVGSAADILPGFLLLQSAAVS